MRINNIKDLDPLNLYSTNNQALINYLSKKKFVHINKDEETNTYIYIKSKRLEKAIQSYNDGATD